MSLLIPARPRLCAIAILLVCPAGSFIPAPPIPTQALAISAK